MIRTTRRAMLAATLLALVTLTAARADDVKPTDGGKGSEFKSKTYDLPAGGSAAVSLTFEAGSEVVVTTKGGAETDIHLHVKGRYYEARDTSPGPNCLVKFTPAKGDDKFTLTVKNAGSSANKVTLEVQVAK